MNQPNRPPNPTEGLTLSVDASVSLNDLVAQDELGLPVLRTPHVGNFSDGNLTTMALGLRHMISDRMMTGRDTIYHPADVIVGGSVEQVAPKAATRSVSHTVVETLPTISPVEAQHGEPLVELHNRALRAAFPGVARFETQTDYMLRYSEITREVVAIVAEGIMPEFNRYMQSDGHVTGIRPEAAAVELKTNGFFHDGGEQTNDRGLLLPNRVAILLDAVIEALEYQSDVVYELCGQTMADYVKKGSYQKLDQLYQQIREQASFGSKLPSQLNVIFVPTADARFVVPTDMQPQVDELLDTYVAHKADEKARGVTRGQKLAGLDGAAKGDLAKELGTIDKATSAAERAEIGRLAIGLERLFAGTDTGQQITQYDLVTDGYYLAPQLLDFSLDAVKLAFKEIGKYRAMEVSR